MTCWTRRERWTASGSILRTVAAARRGIRLLPLHAVLRAGLLAIADAGGVERPAHDLVAHARQVLDAATAHEHDRVLLQVVALAGDVAGDFHAVGQPHARADAPPLRSRDALLAPLAGLQARGRDLLLGLRAALADELIDAWHAAR